MGARAAGGLVQQRGPSGHIIPDRDVLFPVVHLGKVRPQAHQQQVCHGDFVLHAIVHQALSWLRLQMINRAPYAQVVHLPVRRAQVRVVVLFPARIQLPAAGHIRIDRLADRHLFLPERAVLGSPGCVLLLCEILFQSQVVWRRVLRHGRAVGKVAVKPHNVVNHQDHAGGIGQPVVDAQIDAVVPVGHGHHDKLVHRRIHLLKGLAGPFLQGCVDLLLGFSPEVHQTDVARVIRSEVLKNFSVFVPLCEADAQGFLPRILQLDAVLQQAEIHPSPDRHAHADVYFLRAVVLQDFVILQPFGRAQRIEMFHIDPSFFAFQKSSPILHNEASPCGSMFFLFYHMRIKNPMRIFL